MLLTAGVLLGFVSAWFEISLVRHSPGLLNFMCKFKKIPLPLIFSVILSILLGMAFGAAGVTVLLAGVFSTCITQPYYWWHSPEAQAARQRKIAPVKRMYEQSLRTSQVISAPKRGFGYVWRTWAKK